MTRNARKAAMRLLTIAAALAALLLTIALTNAQEPSESQTATHLKPGINLVGWVGEPTSVSQLFREIPQLESIWAWDAELDDWIVAGRGAPEWLGGLGRVWAGTGLRLVLGGEEPFLWQRSTEPTRGLVELRTGWNLVAWSGADDAPLEQVAKGIGWSLRELRLWDAANLRWEIWTSPERSAQLIAASATDQGATDEESEPATVRRGEALWVNVARSVNWLQPTDILPRLVFAGGASDQLQARVREDLESVLAFFGQQYGIQANPTDFTIYIHKDADALIQAFKDDGAHIDAANAAAIRAVAATPAITAGGDIRIQQTHWLEDLSTRDIAWARYTLTHEYFHVLQEQLSHPWTSLWLVEGTASWVESDHQVFDSSNTWEVAREGKLSNITEDTPSLRSTELRNASWEYKLGWLAIDRLTTAYGSGSYVEFWRRLASTEIGPHSRWTSTSRSDWRTAFQEMFGRSVSSFYTEFDVWQWEQAAANGATANPGDDDARWIRGRVTDESGAPVTGALVGANRVEGNVLDHRSGWKAETSVAGEFAVRVLQDGDYLIEVEFVTGCFFYYSEGELIGDYEWQKAQIITVAGSDVQGVNIRRQSNVCGQIRGQVVNAAGEPLAGVSITCSSGRFCSWPSQTAPDGTFTVAVGNRDYYGLLLNLTDGCAIHYLPGRTTLSWYDAGGGGVPIGIADSDVNGLRLQVPSDLCRWRVAGSIEGIERFPRDWVVSVRLCRAGRTRCGPSIRQHLDRDGSFAVAVPMAGSYRISYSLDGCELYHGQTGLTSNAAEAMRFDAGERDVRIGHRRVLDTMCAYQISGTIVGADGAPLDTWVAACEQVDRECAYSASDWTDGDGAFAITVPVNGAYRLSFGLDDRLGFGLDGCTVYFGRDGLTSNINDARLIQVDGRDVQLSQRQLPAGVGLWLCG